MAEDAKPSLLDRAVERVITEKRRKGKCSIAYLLRTNPDRAAEITALIENSGEGHGEELPYTVVAEILNEALGSELQGQTVSRHARNRCDCS